MQITVLFTDVYDGEEHTRTETFDVPDAPPAEENSDIDDWAEEHIRSRTGDGSAVDKDAGYFAKVIACSDRSDLVGCEFEWGV